MDEWCDLDLDNPWEPPMADHPCPKCGSHVLLGYGLAGGGCGSYEVCDSVDCGYFVMLRRDEEAVLLP